MTGLVDLATPVATVLKLLSGWQASMPNAKTGLNLILIGWQNNFDSIYIQLNVLVAESILCVKPAFYAQIM